MRSAKLYRYALPMDSGVILRERRLTEREGFIIELAEEGKIGRAEVAPLQGFSTETMEEAYSQLVEHLSAWQQNKTLDQSEMYPSVAYGCLLYTSPSPRD